jgi:hypothetical protein
VVARLPASQDGALCRFRTKRSFASHQIRVFADPNVDPEGRSPIRLRHPDAELPRV